MANLALDSKGLLKPRSERLKIQKLLEEEREIWVDLISSGQATDVDKERFMVADAQCEQMIRINESEYDVARFAVEYFSDDANPENDENLLPQGVAYDNMSKFHHELCGLMGDITEGKKKSHVAWACPRGHAKTAYGSNIFPVHQAVFRHRRFIVIVSETSDMAGAFITWGNRQLKFNEKLKQDFGVLLEPRSTMNEVDNRDEYVTKNGVKIMARGAGKQIRGMRFGKMRPQLLILDDLEGNEHVSTKEQMEKIRNWFNEEALPAMDKDGMCLYIGTILAYDSLLDYVIREHGKFESRRYRAVQRFPDNKELWDEWTKIYTSDDKDRAAKARTFYEERKEEMDKGVELLWGEYWSYYEFAENLINMGAKSFNQEYQNEPTDEERQIFKPEKFYYYEQSDIDKIPLSDREYYAGIDFAMGKEKGDYSTIATIMKNKPTGRMYVIDVYEGKVHPKEFMEIIVERTMQYQYEGIAAESQMAQEFFTDYLMDGLIKRGYPAHSRVRKVKQRTRKGLRIEALQPEIENGKLRFNQKHKDVINQFEMYPMAKHDDIIDAIEMAYRVGQVGMVGTIQTVRIAR